MTRGGIGAVAFVVTAVTLAGCAEEQQPEPELRWVLACDPCRSEVPTPTGYAWEPSAAIHPDDDQHVAIAVKDGETSISVHVTRDGGATWNRTVLPIGPFAPGTVAESWDFTGDPVAWFMPDGTLLVGGLGIEIDEIVPGVASVRYGSPVFVVRSSDGGSTFGPPSIVVEGEGQLVLVGSPPPAQVLVTALLEYHNHDKPWFAASSDGRILAAWNDLGTDVYVTAAGVAALPYDGNTLLASWSDDGGATWTDPSVVFDGSPRAPFPYFAEGPMRVVLGTFQDDALMDIQIDGENAGGQAGTTPPAVSAGRAVGQPMVAVAGDVAWLVGTADDSIPGQVGPALWRRAPQGDWVFDQQIDPWGAENPHVALAAGSDGALYAAYYGGDPFGYSLWARDPDGGEHRLLLDPDIGAVDFRYGHYVAGLVAGDGVAHVAWPAFYDDGSLRFGFARVTLQQVPA